jgi:homoaconitase
VELAAFLNILDPVFSSNLVLVSRKYRPSSTYSNPFLGLATISNMGAEVGATTSTFPYTPNMRVYLHATGRAPVAHAADQASANGFLAADKGAEYDEVIDIVIPSLFPDLFV